MRLILLIPVDVRSFFAARMPLSSRVKKYFVLQHRHNRKPRPPQVGKNFDCIGARGVFVETIPPGLRLFVVITLGKRGDRWV